MYGLFSQHSCWNYGLNTIYCSALDLSLRQFAPHVSIISMRDLYFRDPDVWT